MMVTAGGTRRRTSGNNACRDWQETAPHVCSRSSKRPPWVCTGMRHCLCQAGLLMLRLLLVCDHHYLLTGKSGWTGRCLTQSWTLSDAQHVPTLHHNEGLGRGMDCLIDNFERVFTRCCSWQVM